MGNRAIKKSQSPASSDVCDEEEPTSGGRLTARRLRHHPGAAASGLSPHGAWARPWHRAARRRSTASPEPRLLPLWGEQLPSDKPANPEGLSQQFHLFTLSPQPSLRDEARPPPALPPSLGVLRSATLPASLVRGRHRGRPTGTAAARPPRRRCRPAAALPYPPLQREGSGWERAAPAAAHSSHRHRRSCLPGRARLRRLRSFPGYFRAGHRPAEPELPSFNLLE